MNHFIEIGQSTTTEDYWLTVHSGSRNYGKMVADYWQGVAKSKLDRGLSDTYDEKVGLIKEKYHGQDISDRIKDLKSRTPPDKHKGLECLRDDDMADYLFNMIFAQSYASINVNTMADTILGLIRPSEVKDIVECTHNYIDFEDLIIRKGAISSREGQKMIIPFNMKDGLLICEGKSNPDWNFSAPHGAGRVFSRSQARKEIEFDDVQEQMKDVFSTSVTEATLDEAPDAYKDSSIIEEAIGPTAGIVDRIVPVHNLKDKEENRRRKRKDVRI